MNIVRQKLKYMDKLLFFLMLLYSILGLVMVFSASSITAVLQYGYSESYFFVRQLIFFVAAYIVGFFVLFMSDKFVRLFRCMPKDLAQLYY